MLQKIPSAYKKSGNKKHLIRRSIAILMAALVIAAQIIDGLGEWYAQNLYPILSAVFQTLTAWIPFSCEELLAMVVLFGLIFCMLRVFQKKQKISAALLLIGEGILWLYVWFYWGWGLNYFRSSYFERADIRPAAYHEDSFRHFLTYYATQLNESYQAAYPGSAIGQDSISIRTEATRLPTEVETELWQAQLHRIFNTLPLRYGLCRTSREVRPKSLWFNKLYSSVGVMGYMGPFFCEMQLNEVLPASQYPFTYAHELSHVSGVSSEAEANYWAYRSCTDASVPIIRYSGYLGLLPYAASTARRLLDTETYRRWTASIRPEILLQAQTRNQYWQERYSPTIGAIQDMFYNWYLKGNKITSGTKNYGEVMSMVLADWNITFSESSQ